MGAVTGGRKRQILYEPPQSDIILWPRQTVKNMKHRGIGMERILVVLTGGTIGSKIERATIDVDAAAGVGLLAACREAFRGGVEFVAVQPLNMLSENAAPRHWEALCAAIDQAGPRGYSGVIITHGTDTLAYTAAMLSFVYNALPVPLVVVGSSYPLEDARSNGAENFRQAVYFILNEGIPGVFCVYRNEKGESLVHLGSRLTEADAYTDQFASFGGIYLGEMKNGALALKAHPANPVRTALKAARDSALTQPVRFENSVLAIRPYPGLDYGHICFDENTKAVLHGLYHSGTACVRGEGLSLALFLRRCAWMGIDCYVAPFKTQGDLYATSREIAAGGAAPLRNIAFEAAYVKLCLAYNQRETSPRAFMEKEAFFEFLPASS